MARSDAVRWGVVCTADEPLPLLCAFALHHLDLGAGEVHLYLDTPRPEHRELLETIEGVRVTTCDRSYWQGRRYRSLENRQARNAQDAYLRSGADWLCHLDCDEFIEPGDARSVAEILAGQTGETDFLILPVRERIYPAGDPVDRLFAGAALSARTVRAGVAQPTPALRRRDDFATWGLVGHAIGKSMIRTGQALLPGIHRPRPRHDHPRRDLGRRAFNYRRAEALHIVHFDGLTPFHWAAKYWRMAKAMNNAQIARQPSRRAALIRSVRDTLPDIGPLREIEREIRHFDPESLAALRRDGLLHPLRIAPDAAAVARGLFAPADFAPAAFDAMLTAMRPGLGEFRDAWLAGAATGARRSGRRSG